jgi:23S rRNA (guanosine2251-2'-O)-methyltransferase
VSRRIVTGKRAVLESVRAGKAREVLIAGSARQTPGMRDVLGAASKAGTPVREVVRAELDAVARNHRGVAALLAESEGEPGTELSEKDLDGPFDDDAIVVVLDGVTDPQNLGACARVAEGAGAAMLVTRVKRAAGVTDAAVRASAGALMSLPHARVANIPRALGRLRDAGFTVVGLDGGAPRTIYDEPCPPARVALVAGAEGTGLSRLAREACDELVSIPLAGKVESLNVSSALASALFAWVLPSRG